MDETILINKTEKFLNNIQKEKIDIKNISNIESFILLYSKFTDRIDALQNMKEDMDAKGYTAPYRSLTKYGFSSSGDVGFEEIAEVNRHSQHFRMKATAKKNILDRVKSAIDSHKIAIGHLDEYGIFICKKCQKNYRPSKFFELKKRCSCESSEFQFKINTKGVYHLEIIPFLPLSGNYMVLMSELNSWGRESFKKVLNILKTEKKGIVKTVSVIVKFKENNRWIRKRISLDSEYTNNYEEEIRKRYGKNIRIEFLQFHRTKPAIINDKHTRIALAIAYVKYSEEIVGRNKIAILEEKIQDISELELYDTITKEVKYEKPQFITEEETLEEWQKFETEKRLKFFKLMDEKNNLNLQLLRSIKKRKSIEKNIFREIAPTLILWDIFKYYLTTSSDRRKRYGGPFPYLRTSIDRQQREVFEKINQSVIEILKRKENQNILELNNMDLILNKKFNLERKIKNSNIKINYVGLGAAIICLNSNMDITLVSKSFNINDKIINKEIKNIENINTPKSEKSRKFLELIKK